MDKTTRTHSQQTLVFLFWYCAAASRASANPEKNAIMNFLFGWGSSDSTTEETMAMREEVYEILPFILTLSNETFETQKLTKLSALPGRGATDFSDLIETSSAAKMGKPGENVGFLK